MATSGDMIVKINSAELLKLEKDGETIVFNQKAEDAIVRLLEIKREVDGVIEYLKSEIERQALEFNPNFTSLKGDKIKINYSASGAKYKDLDTLKCRRVKFWTKKTTWQLNSKAVDEYLAKQKRLPRGIVAVNRKKIIKISEVQNGD